MIDVKRIILLLSWMLVIGMLLVYLRTLHMQSVNKLIGIKRQQRNVHIQIMDQQVELSPLENPQMLKQMLEKNEVTVYPPEALNEDDQEDTGQ